MRLGVLLANALECEWLKDNGNVYGYQQYIYCCDCGTGYRVVQGNARCNNVKIVTCPWCGPDSPANRRARGNGGKRMLDACQVTHVGYGAGEAPGHVLPHHR
jgi:hypothetical protein